MRSRPLVSLILPAYNVEAYLGACLSSLEAQSYSPLEIIAVNDGSTDRTGAILKEWEQRLPSLRVIFQENGGLSCARNRGMQEAQGKYLLFVDSDDSVAPDFVETLVSLAEKEGSDCVCCGTEVIYETKKELKSSDDWFYALPEEGTHTFSYDLLKRLNPNVWNKLFVREVVQRHNLVFPAGLYYEDVAFLWLYAAFCQRITFCPQKLYYYYRREHSIMDKTFNGKLEKALDHLKIALFIQQEYARRGVDKKESLSAFVRVFLGLYESALRFIPETSYSQAFDLAHQVLQEIDFPRCAALLPVKMRHRLYDISLHKKKPQSLKMRHLFWELKRLVTKS